LFLCGGVHTVTGGVEAGEGGEGEGGAGEEGGGGGGGDPGRLEPQPFFLVSLS